MLTVLEEITGLFGRGLWFKDKPNVSTVPLAAIISLIQRVRGLLNVIVIVLWRRLQHQRGAEWRLAIYHSLPLPQYCGPDDKNPRSGGLECFEFHWWWQPVVAVDTFGLSLNRRPRPNKLVNFSTHNRKYNNLNTIGISIVTQINYSCFLALI